MRKLVIALLAALAIVLAAAGCGDDDDNGGDNGSPTETSTATTRPSRTEEAEETPSEDGGEKTPSSEATPAPTEAGPQPTPAAEGTPATLIEDPSSYFSSNYPGQSLDESDCGYSPVTYIVTCGSDRYAPNPPLTGQRVTCALLSVQGQPAAIRCTSREPLQTAYYEIQGS